MTPARIQRLASLFHHRWSVPILAAFSGPGGGRVAELVTTLDGSRGAIRQALDALIATGLVAHQPRHVHPLAPEYALTKRGGRVAAAAGKLVDTLRRHADPEVAVKKWNVPVLAALAAAGGRYADLQAGVPEITDRALTLALRELEAHGLVTRDVITELPPKVVYVPTTAGQKIQSAAVPLAEALS